MRYAVLKKNGLIKIFHKLPQSYHSNYGNCLGGFNTLPKEDLEQHGFYRIADVSYNHKVQKEGELYFDESIKMYKYKIEDRDDIPTLEDLKWKYIKEIENQSKIELSKTNDDLLEAFEFQNKIPSYIVKERKKIRTEVLMKKEDVESIDNILTLIDYNPLIIF